MNLHLYYCPGTCSFVPHVMLELVKESKGQDFSSTMITLRTGEHLKPEYQAINPRSQVPALIVDGQFLLIENAGVCKTRNRLRLYSKLRNR